MTDLDKLAAALQSAIGKNDKQQEVSLYLDTGYPPLNMAISGDPANGFPCGRIIEMFGPSACGKTAIATQAMISAQKAGGVAMWMDHELAFDVTLAKGMGLSTHPGHWAYHQPETFEESVDMAIKAAMTIRQNKLLAPDKPIVVVFDSLTSMIPQSKMFDNKGKTKSTEAYTMHDSMALAKACSSCFPYLAQMCTKHNITMIFINQIRLKPGVMYGNPETTPGGQAPEYFSSLRLSLGREMIKDKVTKEVLGQIVKAKIVKNRMFRPWKTAQWNLMFKDDGTADFDVIGSMVELLAENKVLERDGNGYIWTDGKKYMKPALKAKVEAEGLYPTILDMYLKAGIKNETTPNADDGEADAGLGDTD